MIPDSLAGPSRFFQATALVAFSVVLLSCKKAKPVPPPAPALSLLEAADTPVLKIAPGDFWRYRVTIENPQHPIGHSVSASFERTRRFLGKISPGNGKPETDCFEVTAPNTRTLREFVIIEPSDVSLAGQCHVDADGNQSDLIWFDHPPMFFHAGLSAGDSFPLTIFNKEKNLWRVIRVIGREKVSVPAGDYETVRLQMLGKDGDVEMRRSYSFKPGEGLIREETIRELKGVPVMIETAELIESGRAKH